MQMGSPRLQNTIYYLRQSVFARHISHYHIKLNTNKGINHVNISLIATLLISNQRF